MTNSADSDQDLHCLQRQGISGFSRTRVKILSGIANIVDPDQTAISGAVCTVCRCHFVGNFGVQNFRTFIEYTIFTLNIGKCTLVLLNPDMSCLCKQCTSRSVGF